MDQTEQYLVRRVRQSRRAADDAQHPAAQSVHLTLATLYEKALLAGHGLENDRTQQAIGRSVLKLKYHAEALKGLSELHSAASTGHSLRVAKPWPSKRGQS